MLSMFAMQAAIAIRNARLYDRMKIELAERKQAEEALRESEERYRALVDNASDIVFTTDNTGHFTFVNPAGIRIVGYETEEIIGRHYPTLIRPDMREEAMRFFGIQFVKGLQNTYSEYPVITKEGDEIWLGQNTKLIVQDGHVEGFHAMARDITARKRVEDELRRNQDVAELLAQEMAVIAEIGRVIGSTLDIEEVYERFAAETKKLIPFDRIAVNLHNQSGENVRVAYTSGEKIPDRCGEDLFTLKGSTCEVLTQTRAGLYSHPKNIEEMNHPFPNPYSSVKAEMRSLLRVPLIYRGVVIGSLHFGSKTPDTYTDRELHLAKRIGGQVAGAIGSAQMFSDLKRMEEEIREMSLRDQMTELFNRRGFITLAEQQIRAANRAKKMMMLTFIDLDDLKGINDTLGHKEGDQVLVDAANVLRQTFRESDVVARLGGDEFAVLSIDAADINPEDFPKRLQENIDAVNAKETRSYKLAMSWGMAAYNPGSPLSLDELMSSADERMYAQKKTKTNHQEYEPDDPVFWDPRSWEKEPAYEKGEMMMAEERFWTKSYDPGLTDIDPVRWEKSYVDAVAPIFKKFPAKPALAFMGVEVTFGELDRYANRFADMLIGAGTQKGGRRRHKPSQHPRIRHRLAGHPQGGMCRFRRLAPPIHGRDEIPAQGFRRDGPRDARRHLRCPAHQNRRQSAEAHGGRSRQCRRLPSGVKRILAKLLKKIPRGRNAAAGKIVHMINVIKTETFSAKPPDVKNHPGRHRVYPVHRRHYRRAEGAMLTHRNAVSDLLIVQRWLSWEPGKGPALSGFPFFHIAGLFFNENCIYLGWTQVLIPNPRDTIHICNELAKYRPTTLVNVPSLFQLLITTPKFKSLDHSNLEVCISAASPFPEESQKELESIVGKSKLLEVYGMSETSPLTVMNPSKGKKKLGTIGLPILNTEIKLVDPATGRRPNRQARRTVGQGTDDNGRLLQETR